MRRATVLLLKEKAEMIEIGSQTLHWANGSLAKPVVIRLITYVKIPRDTLVADDPGDVEAVPVARGCLTFCFRRRTSTAAG